MQLEPGSTAEARREAIAAAAVGVFAQFGFGGASLRELAGAAGLEKGHLTYYFRTKDDLLYEVVAGFHTRFVDSFADWAGSDPDPYERLRSVLRHHIELVCLERANTQVAYENMRFLSSDRRAVIVASRRQYEDAMGVLVDECRPTGRIVAVPTSILTKTLLAVANWPYQWFDPDGSETAHGLAAVLADRALAAVASP